MTIQEAYRELSEKLSSIYDKNEAGNIADWVMEYLTGWKKIDRSINKNVPLSSLQLEKLKQYSEELLQHRPVQYVLGEAWFAGMRFYVNENVLIPRPETEELVEWISSTSLAVNGSTSPTTVLDIGTGSGCIPIALKKKSPQTAVFACDISESALKVAAENAASNKADIRFIQCDILNKKEWDKLPQVDIIVSNPPYIPLKDKATMEKNVLDHEPHIALFVDNNDPLIFYKAIAQLAIALSVKALYFEIHEEQAKPILQLFHTGELKKDMQGKDRMIKITY